MALVAVQGRDPGVGAAVAGDMAGLVVVGEDPCGGGADLRQIGDRAVDHLSQPVRLQGAFEEVEVEGGVEFVGAEIVGHAAGADVGLGDEDAGVGVAVGDGAPAAEDVVDFVAVPVRVVVLALVGEDGELCQAEVRECRVLHHAVGDVDTEAVDAQVEPEAQDRLELGPDLAVVPVLVS